jgi:tRNA (guanine-N7-)-methyltransferase
MRTTSPNHLHRSSKWDTAGVLLDSAAAGEQMDLPAIFGNTRPVELEIGSGKGTFLAERAKVRPEVNFLGIEWAKPYAAYAADRFRRAGLSNVRMIAADAGELVRKALTPGSLQRIHIYFPDPWPKRKHHKRRIIQGPFVDRAWQLLSVGGQLLIVTDHLGYFQHIRRVLAEPRPFVRVQFPNMTDADGEVVGTNFERKYIAQGRTFYSTAMLKIAAG